MLLWIAILGVLANFSYLISIYTILPEKVPTHINFRGELDNYQPKKWVFFGAFMGLILVVFLGYMIIKPQLINRLRFNKLSEEELNKIQKFYATLVACLSLFFLAFSLIVY